MENDKRKIFNEIIDTKTIKNLIISYSSKIIQNSKENEDDSGLIKDATNMIVADIESMGVNFSEIGIKYTKTNIEKSIRKQLPNSRMAEKIRNINPKDWNIKR
jgi:hypothetical protein